MTQFVENTFLETEECYSCGMMFAMTQDFRRRRIKDQKTFYCPAGHNQHYTGKTTEQKLQAKLVVANNKINQTERQLAGEIKKTKTVSGKYNRMKKRVINGVCPCCNRTFDNLARHMATKHADFGDSGKLKVLRNVFGLSQSNLAEDIGVNVAQVSAFENDKPVSAWARQALECWVNTQAS